MRSCVRVYLLGGVFWLGAIAAGDGASVNSGAAFLTLDAGARPAAMAGAYTSAAGSLDSLGYNPGGLAALDRKELLLTHAEWIMGTHHDFVGYGQPLGKGVVSMAVSRLSVGTLEGRDDQGRLTGDFTAHDDVYNLGYSMNWGEAAGFGVTAKYLNSVIGEDRASTYAFDVGTVSRLPGARLWVGAAALNVGPGLKFLDQTDPLPLTLAVGAAGQPWRGWTIACDLKHQPKDDYTTLAFGSEFRPATLLALRAGYDYPIQAYSNQESLSLSNLKGGIGLRFTGWRLDYTIAPFDNLGLTHRFTVAFNFGAESESEARKNLQHALQKPPDFQYPYQEFDPTEEDLRRLIESYPDSRANQQAERR